MLSASNAVEQRDSDPLTALVGKGRYVTITAVVDGHGRAASAPWLRGVLETTAKVQTVQEGGSGGDAEPRKSHMRVQLQIGPVTDPELVAAELLPPGTQIALSGFVREPAFPRGTLVAAMSADDVMVLRAAPTWRRSIASMRWKMSEVAAESAGALGPLITGMAIGDDDNLARPVKESMLTTSLTHLTAVSGEHVALVGPSGVGKSTLSAILQGLLHPRSGNVLVAGSQHTSPDGPTADAAVVEQRSYLFNGTIAENLRLVRPDATDDELWAVLEQANLAGEVRAMPSALQTQLGDHGSRLSGGQAGRLAIARALLKDAPFLILDEPTSQVDLASEALILDALEQASEGRAVLTIAHRRAAVRKADRVLQVKDRHIVEAGENNGK